MVFKFTYEPPYKSHTRYGQIFGCNVTIDDVILSGITVCTIRKQALFTVVKRFGTLHQSNMPTRTQIVCADSQCNGISCPDGSCVPRQLVCDGVAQCSDCADEMYENCRTQTCPDPADQSGKYVSYTQLLRTPITFHWKAAHAWLKNKICLLK